MIALGYILLFLACFLTPHVSSVKSQPLLVLCKGKSAWGSSLEKWARKMTIHHPHWRPQFYSLLGRANFSTLQASRYIDKLTKIPSFEAQHFLWLKVSLGFTSQPGTLYRDCCPEFISCSPPDRDQLFINIVSSDISPTCTSAVQVKTVLLPDFITLNHLKHLYVCKRLQGGCILLRLRFFFLFS